MSERQLDFAVSLGADAVLLIVRALSDAELAVAARRRARQRGPRRRGRSARRGRDPTRRGRRRRTCSASTRATSRPSRPTSARSRRSRRDLPPGPVRSGGERHPRRATTSSASRPPATRPSSSASTFCGRRIPEEFLRELRSVTEVKICGLTRERDVDAACELGASILGFNFVGRPRRGGSRPSGRARSPPPLRPRRPARRGLRDGSA